MIIDKWISELASVLNKMINYTMITLTEDWTFVYNDKWCAYFEI